MSIYFIEAYVFFLALFGIQDSARIPEGVSFEKLTFSLKAQGYPMTRIPTHVVTDKQMKYIITAMLKR